MVDFINFSIIYTFCLSGFKLLLVAALSLLCLLFTRPYSQKIGLVARTIQITLLLCAVLYTGDNIPVDVVIIPASHSDRETRLG